MKKFIVFISIIFIHYNSLAQKNIDINVTKIEYTRYNSHEIYLPKIKHVNTTYSIDLKLNQIKVSFENAPDVYFENVSIDKFNNGYMIKFSDFDKYNLTNKFSTSIYINKQYHMVVYNERNLSQSSGNIYEFIDFKISFN
jgi:hypothetical protein